MVVVPPEVSQKVATNVPNYPISSRMNTSCPTGNSVPSTSLVVVPPRRTIFLSRLSPATSIDNIRSYIKSTSVGLNDKDFTVLKFNYSEPRDIASFRILVPDWIFETLVDRSAWPDGTLVREFIRRERVRSEATRYPPEIVMSKN